jgi:hypothetical protein
VLGCFHGFAWRVALYWYVCPLVSCHYAKMV